MAKGANKVGRNSRSKKLIAKEGHMCRVCKERNHSVKDGYCTKCTDLR